MWVVATAPTHILCHSQDSQSKGPRRWFWMGPLKDWTRSVSFREYYESKEKAEAEALLAVALYPDFMGIVEAISVQELHLEEGHSR